MQKSRKLFYPLIAFIFLSPLVSFDVAHAATPTATGSLSANPVAYGGYTTLTWSSTNATSCTFMWEWGDWFTGGPSGSVVIGPMPYGVEISYACTNALGEGSNTVYFLLETSPPTGPYINLAPSVGAAPNFYVGQVFPTAPTVVGGPMLFAMTFENFGTAPTATSFNNRLRMADELTVNDGNNPGTPVPDLSTVQTVAWATAGPLAAGAQTTVSIPYALQADGRFFSICIDETSGDDGVVAEADEWHNCGIWTRVDRLAPTTTCNLPWGGTIPNGVSVTAYQAASVVSPATCVSQSRTCTSPNLSGTYTNQACTVTAAVPILSAPTKSAITTTGATLGATVVSSATSLTARGTCWGTTPAPTTNCSAASGTGISAFTHARTGMTAGTVIYYRGYANNSAGRGYSPDDSFTTTAAANSPPIAYAGADRLITLPTNSVIISGASASDPDGSVASRAWTKITALAGTITGGTTLTPTFSGLAAGTHTFRLTVTDNQGATASDDMIVTVNTPPIASAGSNLNDIATSLPINSSWFMASGESDPDGTVVSRVWSKVSGPAYTISNPNILHPIITVTQENTWVFRLTVTDNLGATHSDDVQYTLSLSPPDLQPAVINIVTVTPLTSTPPTATVGTLTTFGMEIRNLGATGVGTFTNRLRMATTSSGGGSVNVSSATAGPLVGNGLPGAQTSGFTISYTPQPADVGTKWFSICADEDMSGNGSIDEVTVANEGNNCGAWTQVNIVAALPPPAPTCSTFSVTPSNVVPGASVTVKWSCQNATSCTSIGDEWGGTSVENLTGLTLTPAPGANQHYGLLCQGAGAAPGGTNLYSSVFNIVEPKAAMVVSPQRVNAGGSATFTATCTGIPGGSARVTGPSPSGVLVPNSDTTPVDSDGAYSFSFNLSDVRTKKTYWLFCTPASGPSEETAVSSTVSPKIQVKEF